MTPRPARRRLVALLAAGACLPVLSATYQYSAVRLAHAAPGGASWGEWTGHLLHSPWGILLLAAEALSFVLWMVALGELPLAVAFPLTAMGTVLSLLMSGGLLGEAVPPLAWAGVVAILGGAWLIVQPAR